MPLANTKSECFPILKIPLCLVKRCEFIFLEDIQNFNEKAYTHTYNTAHTERLLREYHT